MKNRQRKLALLLCAVMSLSALVGCGQKEEIAEKVSGIIAKALGAQFANMPVKVTL